jgi:hypothetical protein
MAFVTIPNSVTSIGSSAFGYCSDLIEVVNLAETPQAISSNVFSNVNITACTLRVQAGSLAAYLIANVWKDFGTIERITVDVSGNTVYIVNKNSSVLKLVQITDMLGRVVYDGRGRTFSTPAEAILVNGASGIYIVRLFSDDNKVLSTKVHLTN